MTKKVTTVKKVMTVVLSAAIMLCSVLCAPMLTVSATGVTTEVPTMSTEDWKALAPLNGDFEADVIGGKEVYGWTKTSMHMYQDTFQDEPRWLPNYALTTVLEDGNKVLQVNKTQDGYVALTSSPVAAIGNSVQTISFDYKVVSIVDSGENSNNYGVRLNIMEYDAEGNAITDTENKTTRLGAYSGDVTEEYNTVTATFTTKANTAYYIIYIWMGSAMQLDIVYRFDNVAVKTYGYNFDFEAGNAGDNAYNFHEVTIDNNTNGRCTTTNYSGSFTLTNVDDNGNQVLSVNKNGSGYMGAASLPYDVVAGKTYNISFDYMLKEYTANAGATNGLNYLGTRLLVEEFDAEGNTLSTTTTTTSGELLYKTTPLFATHVNVKTADTEWQKAECTYTASANADYVVFYFYAGGQWNIKTKTYFDNLVIEDANPVVDAGYNLDFEAGVENWTVQGTQNNGYVLDDRYNANYLAEAVVENGNTVMKISAKNNITQGYAMVQSDYIPMGAGSNYDLHFDYKFVGTEWDGMTHYAQVLYYNADKTYIGRQQFTGYHVETDMNAGWKTIVKNGTTTPANTAYVRVAFFISQKTYNEKQTVERYIDDVAIIEYDNVTGWTSEDSKESGIPRDTTNTYTPFYGISKSLESDSAFTLFIKRGGGALGGAVYYSDAIAVTEGTEYTFSFDSKIENSVPQATVNHFGASVVVRWLDSEGTLISREDLTGRRFDNMDWTSYSYNRTAPAGAVSAQVGFVIGTYTMNTVPDMRYSYDNIVFMETAKIGTANKPSDLTPLLLEEGDANGDANYNICDLVQMKQMVNGTLAVTTGADMNKNATVNAYDMVMLRCKLLGYITAEKLTEILG